MKSYYHSSVISSRPIPEDDVLDSYGTDSSSGSSLLDERNDSSLGYPPDLLGVSWGSYLHSVPPTAGRSSRKVVINATPQPLETKLPPISAASVEQSPTRSILRTPVVKEAGTVLVRPPKREEKVSGERSEPHPLFVELHALINEVASSKEKMGEYGIDITPLSSLCETLVTSQNEMKETVDQLVAVGSADSERLVATLRVVIQYLKALLQSLLEQGKKLQDQATFLQQTGRQMSKSQQSFMTEQEELQHAMERARAELAIERVQWSFVYEAKATVCLNVNKFNSVSTIMICDT